MATDLAFCSRCNEGFNVSSSIDQAAVNSDVVYNPPQGAWFRQDMDRVVFGATTRSPAAFFLIPFMCVWSGFSLVGIYGSQIAKGQFSLSSSLFGMPFLLGTFVLGALALMAVCGKVEVSIGQDSSVFTGIGKIGWTRKFDWRSVQTIREGMANMDDSSGRTACIVLEGKERLKFGSGLNEQRKYYILSTLKYLKSKRW